MKKVMPPAKFGHWTDPFDPFDLNPLTDLHLNN